MVPARYVNQARPLLEVTLPVRFAPQTVLIALLQMELTQQSHAQVAQSTLPLPMAAVLNVRMDNHLKVEYHNVPFVL